MTWHVWLTNVSGVIIEELLDVEFQSTATLNGIPTCDLTVAGYNETQFTPWTTCIAVTDDRMNPFFFGPVLSVRWQLRADAQFRQAIEVRSQGWEGWFEKAFPSIAWGGAGAETASDAMNAIWLGTFARAQKFTILPPVANGWGTNTTPVYVDWNTQDDAARAGAPSAWGMMGDLIAQGMDIVGEPTYGAGDQFTCTMRMGKAGNLPKIGKVYQKDLSVGGEVMEGSVEIRGDMQANAILTSAEQTYYGEFPYLGSLGWHQFSDASQPGLMLEAQIPVDSVNSAAVGDATAVLRQYADGYWQAFKSAPRFISELKLPYDPGLGLGDVVSLWVEAGPLTGRGYTGRVYSLTIGSDDPYGMTVEMYEPNDPANVLTVKAPGATRNSFINLLNWTSSTVARLKVRRK